MVKTWSSAACWGPGYASCGVAPNTNFDITGDKGPNDGPMYLGFPPVPKSETQEIEHEVCKLLRFLPDIRVATQRQAARRQALLIARMLDCKDG